MVLQTTADPGRYPIREWLPIAQLGPFPMNQRIAYHYPAITDAPHPSNNMIAMVSTERFRNRIATHFMVLGWPDDILKCPQCGSTTLIEKHKDSFSCDNCQTNHPLP